MPDDTASRFCRFLAQGPTSRPPTSSRPAGRGAAGVDQFATRLDIVSFTKMMELFYVEDKRLNLQKPNSVTCSALGLVWIFSTYGGL